MNPAHTFISYLSRIHFNIILPSLPGSSKWFLSFMFSDYNSVLISHLSHVCHMPRPSLPPFFDCLNNIWRRAVCKLWSSSLCSFLQPPAASSLVGPNVAEVRKSRKILNLHLQTALSAHLCQLREYCKQAGDLNSPSRGTPFSSVNNAFRMMHAQLQWAQ
jgi:hypothetical protein